MSYRDKHTDDRRDCKISLHHPFSVALAPRQGNSPRVITGHIDFLQVRNGAVHILDYKPDARTNKPIAQLAIYALALTRLMPGLKLFDIKCAWFNEEEYCEMFPRTLFQSAAHGRRLGFGRDIGRAQGGSIS